MAHIFILTDVSGEHAWRRGNWFVPLDEMDGDDGQVTIFRTKRAARDEVKRQRKRDGHLRVQRIELLPVWPRARRTVFFDDPTVTTFAYSVADRVCSVLGESAKEKDLRQPLANGQPKQKPRRKSVRKGDRTPACAS
jgi:hypothetical protein